MGVWSEGDQVSFAKRYLVRYCVYYYYCYCYFYSVTVDNVTFTDSVIWSLNYAALFFIRLATILVKYV